MVETQIPRWIAALDEEKPYIEVLDGEKLPDMSPYHVHGQIAVRIGAQLDEWAGDRGGGRGRSALLFLAQRRQLVFAASGREYTSYARVPNSMADSRSDRASRPTSRWRFFRRTIARDGRGARSRHIWSSAPRWFSCCIQRNAHVRLHRADGRVEDRDARGAWPLAPFDDLIFDWEKIYRGIDAGG